MAKDLIDAKGGLLNRQAPEEDPHEIIGRGLPRSQAPQDDLPAGPVGLDVAPDGAIRVLKGLSVPGQHPPDTHGGNPAEGIHMVRHANGATVGPPEGGVGGDVPEQGIPPQGQPGAIEKDRRTCGVAWGSMDGEAPARDLPPIPLLQGPLDLRGHRQLREELEEPPLVLPAAPREATGFEVAAVEILPCAPGLGLVLHHRTVGLGHHDLRARLLRGVSRLAIVVEVAVDDDDDARIPPGPIRGCGTPPPGLPSTQGSGSPRPPGGARARREGSSSRPRWAGSWGRRFGWPP